MGLSPISNARWIQPDSQWLRYHTHKLMRGAEDIERVYQCLPEAEPAVLELAILLRSHLLQDHPEHFQLDANRRLCHTSSGTVLESETALDMWAVSCWVQEDLIIMAPGESGYRLVAGSLCLPSRWALTEKIGLAMSEIHEPVPDLNQQIGSRIDRFFSHLRVSQPVERFNWSLQSDAELAEFPGPDEPIDAVHYRVERQTLMRLPDSGAIVFGIRIYLEPLAGQARIPGALDALRDNIATMPVALQHYKRMPHFSGALASLSAGDHSETDTHDRQT